MYRVFVNRAPVEKTESGKRLAEIVHARISIAQHLARGGSLSHEAVIDVERDGVPIATTIVERDGSLRIVRPGSWDD